MHTEENLETEHTYHWLHWVSSPSLRAVLWEPLPPLPKLSQFIEFVVSPVWSNDSQTCSILIYRIILKKNKKHIHDYISSHMIILDEYIDSQCLHHTIFIGGTISIVTPYLGGSLALAQQDVYV